MIKSRIKYLITLYLLLTSTGGQLVANTSYFNASYQQVENQEFSKNINSDVQQGNFAFSFTSFVYKNKGNFIFDYDEKFEEDDKDDVVSQKRNVENSSLLSSLFNNNYAKLFFLKNPQALHFSKHFLHIPYNKLFIVFQVFRI